MAGEDSRRGQSAASAAVLVAIVGAVFVLYILFLPAGQREALLFGDQGGQTGGQWYGGSQQAFVEYGPTVLLAAVPGTLRLQRFPTEEHAIPSATIFTSVQTEEIKFIESALVKNGVFSSQAVEIEFQADRQSTNNYLLSFNVRQAGSAPLRVKLNGKLLQERPMIEGTPPPIPLPLDYMEDGVNVLTIETSSAGLAFWRSNAYWLTNLLVSADIIDVSGSVSEQLFSITEREIEGIERAELQFVPECDPRRAGRLTVQMGSRIMADPLNASQPLRDDRGQPVQVPNILYTGFVDCGVQFKTDIPVQYLRLGENHVLFASQGGQYVVDRIKVITYLAENDYPTYYFNINPELYDVLSQGHGALRLTMRFNDYRNAKNGEVSINGFVQSFQTGEYIYQALMDPAIVTPGPNTIQVIPHVDKLDIAELRVELI